MISLKFSFNICGVKFKIGRCYDVNKVTIKKGKNVIEVYNADKNSERRYRLLEKIDTNSGQKSFKKGSLPKKKIYQNRWTRRKIFDINKISHTESLLSETGGRVNSKVSDTQYQPVVGKSNKQKGKKVFESIKDFEKKSDEMVENIKENKDSIFDSLIKIVSNTMLIAGEFLKKSFQLVKIIVVGLEELSSITV